MAGRSPFAALWAWALDFALPPRCPGCGTIVDAIHSFCSECWTQLDFLGPGGCASCGMPLEGTDFQTCAVCLARPPRIARARALVAYDELSRRLVIKLKYGRKVALAKTMARYMAPLLDALPPDAVLVPVPLHRQRLWQRGFNQAAILARELSKRVAIPTETGLLKRIKRTPPLKGMNRLQRRRAVAGAFQAAGAAELRGRTVVLVDDVLTTGSTANACARALRRAGAARVDLVSWARVVRPAHLSS
ncbi:ComF family protein [Sphingomonas sp.]|uniref:ComF family protein n=1 Tax=Sphingomonas sp. TaxID=28214 RepID=UPI00286D8557|nr:ComF family protein [Sphingomonas sp.]